MIDRDVVLSLKHLDGSGPFFSLTKLHANYIFDLFFSVGFYLIESVGYEFFYFDLIISVETVKRLGLNWLDVRFLFDWNYPAAPRHLITSPLNHSKRKVFSRRKM